MEWNVVSNGIGPGWPDFGSNHKEVLKWVNNNRFVIIYGFIQIPIQFHLGISNLSKRL